LPSFGERLKREREKKSMTLDEVSSVTKISTRSLRALEEEKFDQLPGGIFNKGFVRAYARQLGIDEEQAIADYLDAAGETELAVASAALPAPPPEPEYRSRDASQIPWGTMTIVLLMAALAVAGWGYYSHRKSGEAPAVVSETPKPQSPGATPVANTETKPPETPPTQETAAASGFDLALHGRQEVWLLIAQDDQAPTEMTLKEGQTTTVHAASKVVLRVGNAAGLAVSFNGQPITHVGGQDQVKTLTFTAAGLETPAVPTSAN
jgi:cytoskeletal protein RodZ